MGACVEEWSLRLQLWTPGLDGVIILAMWVFRIGMSRMWAVAAFLPVFLVGAAVVGQPPEPVLSGEGRIEVFSPGGVATFEGELWRPW